MGKLNWVRRACAAFALCAATAIALRAQTFTTLHSFDNTDGEFSQAALVQASDGNLYGTTTGGGGVGSGTVFKITPSGVLTTLYSFGGADGASPSAALIQATDGNFYGTTYYGGANGDYGTVFKITPSGTLTTLYSFCSKSGCPDGQYVVAGLIQAIDGNLYGATSQGGTNAGSCTPYGCGTVFKITLDGTRTTLHRFDRTDGANPSGALVQASDGNLYGTTTRGGADSCGTVFKITTDGTLATLYSFGSQTAATDGCYPDAALVQGADGSFYGTTQEGGTNGDGTVFKISPSGALTTIYSFCSESNCSDGNQPYSALVQATDGSFYGTTAHGGGNAIGTIFKITLGGALTTLHTFASSDGANPYAAPVQDTNGKFYGTTYNGGAIANYGTIFGLSVGLGPFVETQTTSGKVGGVVKILGTNLTGATGVTFNGTAAVFHVVSPSFITATVPAGATSGKVQVVTPGGTLSSNVPFRVRP